MDVRVLSGGSEDALVWDAYVDRAAGATSDHLWGWRQVLSGAFGYRPHYLGAWEAGRMVGILPLFHIPRGLGRSALSSIPFGNYGGICADSEEAALGLLNRAKRLLGELKGDYLELRHRSLLPVQELRPQRLYSRFTFPLYQTPERHFDQVSGSLRSKIRRSRRDGLSVVASDDLDALSAIHTHTSRRHGTPCFPRRYFHGILEAFSGSARIYLVTLQGKAIAYSLCLFFKGSMVCQFNGALESFFRYYPNELLFWNAILEGCRNGLRQIDYCRSRVDSGSAEFKRRLNFTEEPLGYQYFLPNGNRLPERNPSNPKLQWMIRAWRGLPLGLTRLLGPVAVRYLA